MEEQKSTFCSIRLKISVDISSSELSDPFHITFQFPYLSDDALKVNMACACITVSAKTLAQFGEIEREAVPKRIHVHNIFKHIRLYEI